jgi:hypothetical protein
VVVLIYKFVIQTPVKTKRWVINAPAQPLAAAEELAKRYVIPGLSWTPENDIVPTQARHVVPGVEWVPETVSRTAKRAIAFVA